ncbi:MAG: sulfite exporter TauE/SafE family protein [Myxococcales bacterium]|nr:sulfite exporter TauE/SafE family protein [Myxococcales bacterium]
MGLLAGIVFLAFLVEAAAGFGSMVVAMTMGALWFPVPQLLGWLVPVNLVLSVYLVLRGRSSLDWGFFLKRMLPVMALGLVGGTVIAGRAAQAAWLKPAFGVFVVGVAAWQLTRGRREGAPLSQGTRALALLGAGVLHGVYATGGPLAVFVSARELKDKAAFRATLSALWVVLNLLVLPRLVVQGEVTEKTLGTSALMLGPLALGILAGEWVHHRLDEGRFRVAVSALLLLAGGVLAAGSLTEALPR